MRARSALLLGVCLFSGNPAAVSPPVPTAQPNDNRTPAGNASGTGVSIALEARRVMFYPQGDSLPGRATEAFNETGKEPMIPGPLVRIRAGTPVRISIRSIDIPDTLRLVLAEGLSADTVVIPPGKTGELRITPREPGNYFYRAFASDTQSSNFLIKGLLAGAFIVDSANTAPRPDRVLVVHWLVDSLMPDKTAPNYDRMVFGINGRSWPYTERLNATVGDSVRWRIINLNADVHPLHLHGVYFRVYDLRGPHDALPSVGANGRMVVTERMEPFTTMSMAWLPQRAGNWLFHCHFAIHLTPIPVLLRGSTELLQPPKENHDAHANHAMTGMAGLVMGIAVKPRPGVASTEAVTGAPRRRLRLVAFADSGYADTVPSYRFRLEEARTNTRLAARPGFSPPIVLTRGEPVSIMVVNTLTEATAVHWHGIELESFYDGVAGFGGSGQKISPVIAPRDSFEALFTPPRSGTFIYHSHVNEIRQHAAGLLGALIVRDGTAPLTNDHTIFLKAPRAGPASALPLDINGQPNPDTITFPVGVPQRIRLIALTAFNPNAVVWLTTRTDSALTIKDDSLVVKWKPVAKDGADLPQSARTPRVAGQMVSMGETYDFEYVPPAKGLMRIEVRGASGRLLARVPVRTQ